MVCKIQLSKKILFEWIQINELQHQQHWLGTYYVIDKYEEEVSTNLSSKSCQFSRGA